ncbi:hypothetical protein [Sphingobacterium bambusae]|uniref:Outer membrane protein beta-barrel domain-containing protein n=1 Tax=Sphingobacterium bambusae TaxID=662858 RepID=A0ABW6BNY4_9SPHI|nr:hypothetical protein [Sphingobacterium bambusae]WPL47936.1 hypothetical protein SCB77_18465 [Sphingobacterium bambusae]
MKYFLFITLFFCATSTSFAQQKFIISTHVGFNNNHKVTLQDGFEESTNIENRTIISPRFAYRINRALALGLSYQFSRITSQLDQGGSYYNLRSINNMHAAGLFIQPYLYDNGKIAVFLEGDIYIGRSKSKLEHDGDANIQLSSPKSNLYTMAAHAGARYNFYKGLGLEARLNHLLSYNTVKHLDIDGNETGNSRSFTAFNDILGNVSLGLSFSF